MTASRSGCTGFVGLADAGALDTTPSATYTWLSEVAYVKVWLW
jgi:hypothetical protein